MTSTLKIFSILSLFPLLMAAGPIKGSYLPENELPKSVCKIQVGLVTDTYTPTFQNARPNGKPSFTRVQKDVPMCSSTLIAPNTILTAAHCFSGSNEQTVQRGTFAYPKMINGVLIEGCHPENWEKDPKCVAGKEYGIVQTKWDSIEVLCPTNDGTIEARPLTEEMGYPNPLFKNDSAMDSISAGNFDVAVWRFEKPFERTPVVEVATDFAQVTASIKENWKSCKSFGYGLDNDQKYGTLHGAITPITKSTFSYLMSDDAILTDDPFLRTGRIDHGDSGGALICKDLTGKEKLFGVVSRGGLSEAPGTTQRANVGLYAMPAYNAPWIARVLKDGPLKHDLSSKWWHSFVLPYEQQQMFTTQNDIQAFMKLHRNGIDAELFKAYNAQLAQLRDQYKKALVEYHKYGDDAGLLRTRVRAILTMSLQLYFQVQKSTYD